MINIYNRTLPLIDALKEYDKLSVYNVYYINPVAQRQLMLNFGPKEKEEIIVRDSLKYIEITEEVDISVTTYATIPGLQRTPPLDHIKILRPLYNLILIKGNTYKEDMPHHYFIHYVMIVYKGMKVFYDPQGFVMIVSLVVIDKSLVDEILNL